MLWPFDSSWGNWKTNVGSSPCARRHLKCEYPSMPRRHDDGGNRAPYIEEDQAQEQLQFGTSISRLHHRQHTLDLIRPVEYPAVYPGFASSVDSAKVHSYLAITHTCSSIYRSHHQRPSPFLDLTHITPVSPPRSRHSCRPIRERLHRARNSWVTLTSSSLLTPTPVPNPRAGQGVLKSPTAERRAQHKPAIASLFCRERKITCGASLVGSADTVPHAMLCHYPLMLIGDIGNLPLGLASAHDARASVNIPQFRGATHEQFHQGMPLVAALIMSATARSSSSNSKPPRRPRILSRRTNHPISQLRRM